MEATEERKSQSKIEDNNPRFFIPDLTIPFVHGLELPIDEINQQIDGGKRKIMILLRDVQINGLIDLYREQLERILSRDGVEIGIGIKLNGGGLARSYSHHSLNYQIGGEVTANKTNLAYKYAIASGSNMNRAYIDFLNERIAPVSQNCRNLLGLYHVEKVMVNNLNKLSGKDLEALIVPHMGESFEEENKILTIMEEVEPFITLKNILRATYKDHPLYKLNTPKNILKILLQVLDAIKELSDKEIVHNDIKADNIRVDTDVEGFLAQLYDFDLAQRHGVRRSRRRIEGTPGTMSSEYTMLSKKHSIYNNIFGFVASLFILLPDQYELIQQRIKRANGINEKAKAGGQQITSYAALFITPQGRETIIKEYREMYKCEAIVVETIIDIISEFAIYDPSTVDNLSIPFDEIRSKLESIVDSLPNINFEELYSNRTEQTGVLDLDDGDNADDNVSDTGEHDSPEGSSDASDASDDDSSDQVVNDTYNNGHISDSLPPALSSANEQLSQEILPPANLQKVNKTPWIIRHPVISISTGLLLIGVAGLTIDRTFSSTENNNQKQSEPSAVADKSPKINRDRVLFTEDTETPDPTYTEEETTPSPTTSPDPKTTCTPTTAEDIKAFTQASDSIGTPFTFCTPDGEKTLTFTLSNGSNTSVAENGDIVSVATAIPRIDFCKYVAETYNIEGLTAQKGEPHPCKMEAGAKKYVPKARKSVQSTIENPIAIDTPTPEPTLEEPEVKEKIVEITLTTPKFLGRSLIDQVHEKLTRYINGKDCENDCTFKFVIRHKDKSVTVDVKANKITKDITFSGVNVTAGRTLREEIEKAIYTIK